MNSVIKTAPTTYPVTLKEAKEHLNITIGWTDDDTTIQGHIKVATKKAEQYLRRRIITQTWYAYYERWPAGNAIVLPFGKLQSVTSVKYTDTDGDESTWDSSTEYDVDTYHDPGRIVLAYGKSWPSATLAPTNPIVVEFVCGYGTSGADVEDMIKHAMKLILDDLYNQRGDIIIGQITANMHGAKALLMPYRLHERPTQ
jgi:uncharacterized phiE125 gp8 family phage protein